MIKEFMLASSAAMLVAAAPQDAQTVPGVGNSSLSASRPTAVPTPAPPVIELPSSRATSTPQGTPTPRAAPTPRATPPRTAAAPPPREPRAVARPASAVTAPPGRRATTAIVPATEAGGALIEPMTSPTPLPSPAPIVPLPAKPERPAWLIPTALLALAALIGGIFAWRRGRRRAATDPVFPAYAPSGEGPPQPGTGFWAPALPASPPIPAPAEPPAPPIPIVAEPPAPPSFLEREPEPEPEPAPLAAVPTDRAWIELDVTPRRAGLNLLSATVDLEIALRNVGTARAESVRIDVRMLNAGEAQDHALEGLFDAAMARPVVPPFTLDVEDSRTVRAIATLPRDAIVPLSAGGREIFVPVVTVDVRYETGEGSGQTAAAFAIGVTRAGAEKLAPFRLDAASKMHETVGARAQGPVRAR